MNVNRLSRLLFVGLPLAFAACGGDNLTLPSEGEPAKIQVMKGDKQSARVGTALADSLIVQVTDTRDRPVANAEVVFEFTDATSGDASPASITTDVDGNAKSRIRLGGRVGAVAGRVSVPVPEGTTPVQASFTATALPDNANGIAKVSGDDQIGAVGTDLALPLVVKVTDNFGNPISGFTVSWSAEGGGSVSQASTVTGDDGQTSVTRTLGPNASIQTTVATTSAALAGSPVTFTHTATAGSASRVEKFSGDGQSALAGSELAASVVVRVLDAANNPIPNRAVTWVIGAGGGSVTPQNSTTDVQGKATARWTLGSSPGNNTLNAVVSGAADGTATFSATGTATPGPTAAQIAPNGGEGQSGPAGSTLGTPLSVKVTSSTGAPVSGVTVSWAALDGGTVSSATSSTNGDGIAQVQRTLGNSAGTYRTRASVSGLNGSPVTFTATASPGGPSASTSTVTASPQTITVGSNSTVTVRVKDGNGNAISGVSVTLAASGDGNTITPASASTNASGVATFTFSSSVAGSKTITATAGGVTIDDKATITVQKASSTVEITSDDPEPSTVGQNVRVEFTVSGSGGTPTGDVTVTVSGGPETCTGTLTNGAGFCDVVLTVPGTGSANRRTITASYGGDANFGRDDGTKTHRTNPAPPPPPANNPPSAVWTTTCTGLTCDFKDLSVDSDGSIVTWFWEFSEDDGVTIAATSPLQNPQHTWASEGLKFVRLTVTDNDGAKGSLTERELTVAPTSSFVKRAGTAP